MGDEYYRWLLLVFCSFCSARCCFRFFFLVFVVAVVVVVVVAVAVVGCWLFVSWFLGFRVSWFVGLLFSSRMRSEGFSFNFGSTRWLFSCPQVFESGSYGPAVGESSKKVTFHGCVACQFAPLFHCDLHKIGTSCKKGDAFRCTGAWFCESDTFAS